MIGVGFFLIFTDDDDDDDETVRWKQLSLSVLTGSR